VEVIAERNTKVTVTPFLEQMGTIKDVFISDVIVAYDHPATRTTFILKFHQVLVFDGMEHHLLCSNQLRLNDILVDEVPRCLAPKDKPDGHRIYIPEVNLTIPLLLDGVISYFSVRRPTEEDKQESVWIDMSYDSPAWNPYDPSLKTRELALMRNEHEFLHEEYFDIDTDGDGGAFMMALSTQPMLSGADRATAAIKTRSRRGAVSAEDLARRWGIGLATARKTIEVVTQKGVRYFGGDRPVKRMWAKSEALRFRSLNTFMFTDTVQGPCESRRGNAYFQLYTTDASWTGLYPMKKKSEAHETLDRLFHDVGVPKVLVPDMALELTMGTFAKKARAAGAQIHPIEPRTPNHQRCETVTLALKRMFKRAMRKSKAPTRLWDDCYELQALIYSHIAHDKLALNGEVPQTHLLGDTADISSIAEFEWYEPVWYWTNNQDDDNYSLGRYLGPARDIGQAMTAKVLTDSGRVMVRSSVFPLTEEDKRSEGIALRLGNFDAAIASRLGAGMPSEPDSPDDDEPPVYDAAPDEHREPDADDVDFETMDRYTGAEILLPQGVDSAVVGKVIGRKRGPDGKLIGRSNANPLLDTATYNVEFPDGRIAAYAANILADHIYSTVDEAGHRQLVLSDILDHKSDHTAVPLGDQFVTDGSGVLYQGRPQQKKTTRGWWLLVKWADLSESWERLADLKESHPVQVAEYAVANHIADQPAFSWWVNTILRSRERIISKVKARVSQRTHKFGIEVPRSVQQAIELDKRTGTTLWQDAIAKEMANVAPAFKILEHGAANPIGHQFIRCHLIFDVKLDLTRKARYVAGGHVTETPASLTYQSVVSRESVRIAFLIAALNDLDICSADIQNAYITAPCRERIWTTCGPEFGPQLQGRKAVIVRALYGLKSAARAFGAFLAETLHELGWKSCRGEADVRMRPLVKANGERLWEYLLVYTDDLLCVAQHPRQALEEINKFFKLKPSSIGEPKTYLGSGIGKYYFPDEPKKHYWSMCSEKYVKEAIKNVETYLLEHDSTLHKTARTPLPSGYAPELDVSPELKDTEATYFMSQISVLRWAVELGRIDIATEVSMLSSHMALPRRGHLDAMFHIFSYLKSHSRSRLVFDAAYKDLTGREQRSEWREFYDDAKEVVPPDAPEPRGKSVQIIVFVDASHASERLTRRSRTGVLIYLNSAPISWLSKKQNSIETSSFGSEFTALRIATEMIVALRFKLMMMGIPIDGPAHVRCDNQSVVTNTSVPESTLQKKHNAVAYHYVREKVAAGIIEVHKEDGKTNLADMLTKIQVGPVRESMAAQVLY
jgi:hypothetical protein